MIQIKEDVRREAIQIISEHIRTASICMVTFDIIKWALKPESLTNQWMDKDGNIWFWFFDLDENTSLDSNGNMEVFYSNVQQSQFMSLVGQACEASEADKHNQTHPAYISFRHSGIKTPFKMVKFIPHRAFYWNDDIKDMIPLRLVDEMIESKLCA